MHITTRREFVKQVAAGIGGLAFSTVTTSYAQPKPIRIAVYAPSHCAFPAVYAYHTEIYKKNGINCELVYCDSMQIIMKKLINKEVEFAQLMSPMVFQMHFGQMKAPQTSLAVTQVLGTNGGVLGVATQSNINKIKDLSNKKIGIHSPLMVHNIILQLLLEKYGLSKDNMQIIVVPMKEMKDALVQRKIDGFINPEPLPTLLESNHLSKSILLTRMFWKNHPCCLLTTRKEILTNDLTMAEDVTRATSMACLILDDVTQRKQAISRFYDFNTPYKVISLSNLQKAFMPRRSDFYPFPFISSGYVIIQQMKKMNLLPLTLNTESSVKDIFMVDLAMKMIKQASDQVPGSSVPSSPERDESFHMI